MNRNSDPALLLDNPRATYRAWKQYEVLALAALAHFPKTYVFCPHSLRPSTVASRVRDAIRGLLAFNYPILSDPPVSHGTIADWWSRVIVKHNATHVFIGSPDRVLTELTGKAETSTPGLVYKYETLTFEEITAFTILISSGRINGPVIVTSPPDVSLIPERSNVELEVRPDGKLLIL